jgi:hypothetical protein
VGSTVGSLVGSAVGSSAGSGVGSSVTPTVGSSAGGSVGTGVGVSVGTGVAVGGGGGVAVGSSGGGGGGGDWNRDEAPTRPFPPPKSNARRKETSTKGTSGASDLALSRSAIKAKSLCIIKQPFLGEREHDTHPYSPSSTLHISFSILHFYSTHAASGRTLLPLQTCLPPPARSQSTRPS